jgi:biopolymer transport protein ExbD
VTLRWSHRPIGLALILIGIAWIGGWFWWRDTRRWTPLDVPVSLAAGYVTTADFEINVESKYAIGVLPYQPKYPSEELQHWLGLWPGIKPILLNVRWTVRARNRVVGQGISKSSHDWFSPGDRSGALLGELYLPKGHYELELENLADGRRLDGFSPYLMVVEWGGVFGSSSREEDELWSRLIAVLQASAGVWLCLHFRAFIEKQRDLARASATPWLLTQPGPQAALAGCREVPADVAANRRLYQRLAARVRHAEMRAPCPLPFSRLSWFSHLASMVFLLLFVIVQPFDIFATRPVVGLRVRLVRPGTHAERSPGIQPVLVRVNYDQKNRRATVTVDSQPVTWEELETVLRRELRLRPPDWPVYVEGDREMEWQWAAMAIDVVQGLHTPVVLLTR